MKRFVWKEIRRDSTDIAEIELRAYRDCVLLFDP